MKNKNKHKNKQINIEAWLTVLLYLFYFVWWYYFAYKYGTDATKYNFIFGLPEWFFYSCVLGLVVINLLVLIVVKLFFKNVDLD